MCLYATQAMGCFIFHWSIYLYKTKTCEFKTTKFQTLFLVASKGELACQATTIASFRVQKLSTFFYLHVLSFHVVNIVFHVMPTFIWFQVVSKVINGAGGLEPTADYC